MDGSSRQSFKSRCSGSRPHLLIAGRDLRQLAQLSTALHGFSQVMTLAVTDDPAERAFWEACHGPSQVILCLDESDSAIDIRRLVEISPPALILAAASIADVQDELAEADCLVLSACERPPVVAAMLMASHFSGPRLSNE